MWRFYAERMGVAWLGAGYFRLLLIGSFEGLDSERGMAWRAAIRILFAVNRISLGKERRVRVPSGKSRRTRCNDIGREPSHYDVTRALGQTAVR